MSAYRPPSNRGYFAVGLVSLDRPRHLVRAFAAFTLRVRMFTRAVWSYRRPGRGEWTFSSISRPLECSVGPAGGGVGLSPCPSLPQDGKNAGLFL